MKRFEIRGAEGMVVRMVTDGPSDLIRYKNLKSS